jgi:hypothetical protein
MASGQRGICLQVKKKLFYRALFVFGIDGRPVHFWPTSTETKNLLPIDLLIGRKEKNFTLNNIGS